ncbi:ALC-interacting protein 1, TON1 Recruiting Motif 29 [Hibiscus trionum]|uniref:ALC-interacting protein 1, TON1 Recruiting Motif 29 n=1 Tax=Hibiscus trionum TaxID=183268 RepID=A0A9W7IXT6_HIBTR|nr:ALC-interacting protein 1, TON1 Recruiting Motif 29 [Hibiscus trionum]
MSNTNHSSFGCFSAVFRRLLCTGSPQTHPSDKIMESNADDNAAKVRVQSESGPGIVAKLMGLDSLPEKNWVSKGKTPGQITRSRSVNFMDYMLEFDLARGGHRRVKTSTSFREVLPQGPQLLQQQNQNNELLVVYMDENKEMEFEPRKLKSQKLDCKNEHQEKNRKISKLKDEPRRVFGKNVRINRRANSRGESPLNEVSVETKKKKKKKNQCEVKKDEYSENSSEGSGSSPVSVLEINDFSEDSKSLEVKLEESFELTDNGENVFHMELVDRPRKLTDEDIKFSNWITKKVFTFEDFEEICVEFEDQILDLMLHQVVDELVGLNV